MSKTFKKKEEKVGKGIERDRKKGINLAYSERKQSVSKL